MITIMSYLRIQCPLCTSDFGQEARFTSHLFERHAITDAESLYVTHVLGGARPRCACSADCQARLTWTSWKKGFSSKYVRGHNARVDSVYLDPAAQAKFAESRRDGFASGRLKSWNSGLTKETTPEIAASALRASQTLSARYAVRKHTKSPVTAPKTPASLGGHVDVSRRPDASLCQHEIFDYVRSLGVDAVLNDRSMVPSLELGVYVPSRKFAIEYDSLYWHSDVFCSDADEITEKMTACTAAGIKLLRVFEDEWRDKRSIIESMIRARLGLLAKAPAARKCKVVELSPAKRREFFEKNHLDGDARSTVAFGLVSPTGDVVSAMSLRRPFHAKWSSYMELARSASATDTNSPGAVSKLTKHASAWAAARGKTGLLSYVDLRHGSGESYERSGFTEASRSKSRFWWTDFERRYNRFWCRADRDAGLTQEAVATSRGVAKIFGCGNRVMLKSL